MEIAISVLIGVALSATSGFRVFVPFLVLSAASMAGLIELGAGFEWMGTHPALLVFSVATVVELLAYFFPFLDNILNGVSIPVAFAAGTLITMSLISELDPLAVWSLSIIAGGGSSLFTSTVGNVVRLGSTALTGGLANWVVSLVETVLVIVVAVMAVLVPVLSLIMLVVVIYLFSRAFRRFKPGRTQSQAS